MKNQPAIRARSFVPGSSRSPGVDGASGGRHLLAGWHRGGALIWASRVFGIATTASAGDQREESGAGAETHGTGGAAADPPDASVEDPLTSRCAHTCLRPPSTAQPCAALVRATRYSPMPPAPGSRPTAGAGGASAAASLTSSNHPAPVVVRLTSTGGRPCRTPLLVSSSKASSIHSMQSSSTAASRSVDTAVRSWRRRAERSVRVAGSACHTVDTAGPVSGGGWRVQVSSFIYLTPGSRGVARRY